MRRAGRVLAVGLAVLDKIFDVDKIPTSATKGLPARIPRSEAVLRPLEP